MGSIIRMGTVRGLRVPVLGLMAAGLIATLAPHVVAAQTPEALYSYQAPIVIDNTGQGDNFQCYERPRQTRRLMWNQTEYMVLDASTDILIYNPQNAQIIDKGHFGLGSGCGGILSTPTPAPVPDQIYSGLDGIVNFTVCDECRWGVVNSSVGAVIFDLGNPAAGGNPVVDNPTPYASTVTGGTYRVGSQQYVMLRGGYGSPFYNKCPTGQMGIYTLSAAGVPSTNPIWCSTDPSTFDPREGQEVWVPFTGGPAQPFYVYQQEPSTSGPDVNVVQIGSDGVPILPPENAVPFIGGNQDYFSIDRTPLSDAIDPHFWLLITNQSTTPNAHVYKVTPSAAAVALDFQEVANFTSPGVAYDRGGIHYPYVFLTSAGGPDANVGFFDLSTSPPTQLDNAYWSDPSSDFNTAPALPSGMENTDAYFTNDGGWMWFARYRALERFKYTPSNPVASAAVTPSPAYWGDTVTVDASGSGGAAEYALWIDDDPTGTAATSTVVAGIKPSQAGAWGSAVTLGWTVPNDPTPPYYGHVAVRDVGRGYPYDPVNHPEMLANKQVTLNLTPSAVITAPDTVFLGDTATLKSTDSEGNPTAWGWTIQAPSGATTTPQTANVNQTFNEAGSWSVDLTVFWKSDHSYSDAATPVTVMVKSALASFTISPTPQYNNQAILLDGSASKPSGSLTYQWSVLNYNQQEVWSDSGETATTTIPADTLTPGSYTVKLTVRNVGTQEIDIATQGMTVQDGSAGISITPTNPERGQAVTFQINGIDGISTITWHFGGPSCDGSPADWTCTAWCTYPTTYTYSTANTYNVSAVVTSSSGTRTLNGTVTVQPTGQCTGVSCSYTASASPSSFGSSGGTGTLSVGASSTSCAWTASSNASWLVLSQTSGTGAKSVAFSVGANNTGSTRSATITVSGGAITRTVTVSQSSGTVTGSLTISPATPDRGQRVTFSIVGVDGIQGVTWHFGGASCNGDPQDQDCSGIYCTPTTYTYSTAGTYSVSAVVHTSGSDVNASGTVVVQASGQCTGTACSYSLTASATSFGASGGSGTVGVEATSGCSWTATSNASWLHISGANTGTGSGSFGFTVDANSTGAARSAQLSAGGKSVTISQTITATGTAVVPAAARTVGQAGTNWQTDLWIFNPNNTQVTVNVRFYPDNADNSDVPNQPPLVQKLLAGFGTAFLPDVLGAVVPPGNLKGALGIDVSGTISKALVISSRTFNTDLNGGTYGQFVPVVQGSPPPVSTLYLTGLREDSDFRTNIGLVSGSANAIGGIVIHVLDQNGTEVGSYGLGLNPYGMTQVDNIVNQLNPPPTGDMSIFSVKIDFVDWKGDNVAQPVTAYASVIDNNSSDAIFIPAVTEP